MNSIKERIGDDTSDEAIHFLENLSDTYNDLESKSKETAEATEWHNKYDEAVKEKAELDNEWKQKYRDRFFSSDYPDGGEKGGKEEPPTPVKYEDLFTTKGD